MRDFEDIRNVLQIVANNYQVAIFIQMARFLVFCAIILSIEVTFFKKAHLN